MKSFVHERNGIRFAVWESGEGAPVVFQHGLTGDATQTADVFPVDSGYRCLTLECRGHGGSDAGPLEGLSIATFTDDVVSMIEAQGLAPVVLGGISMGAAISLRLAVLRPDLVRALILARPAWIEQHAPPNIQPNAVVGELLRQFPPDEARARFEASETARTLSVEGPDNLASLRTLFSREPISTTRELLCRISAGGPDVTRSQIEAIRVPTVVIGCTRDFVHPLEMARELAVMVPHAKMIEITSKSESLERYRHDFRSAFSVFLTELSSRRRL